MQSFKPLLFQEAKRFFNWRNILIIVLLLLISLFSLHKGTKGYNNVLQTSKEFQDIEESYFEKILSYLEYSNTGINVFFIPSNQVIFFSSPAEMSELYANINTIIAFNIFNNRKGKLFSRGHYPFRLRFSNIVYLLGSLVTLLFGFESMRNLEYLKFISSVSSPKKVFFSILLARGLLVIFSLLVLFSIMLSLALIEGINFKPTNVAHLSGYLIVAVLMLLFFFISGATIGCIRLKGVDVTVLLVFWISFVLIIPGVINSLVDEVSENVTSSFKLDNDKLKVVNEFEKRAVEEKGEYNKNTIEGRREVVEGYWNNDFKQVEALEDQYKIETVKQLQVYSTLSLITPTSFYTLTASEVSSRGYGNYFAFYRYLQQLWQKFVRFWIDRVYYHDPKVMVNFVKGDENLFYAKSRLPANFGTGVVVNLGYIIIMLAVSFFLFKRSLFRLDKKEIEALGDRDIEVKTNEVSVWRIKDGKGDAFNKMFFTLLSREIDRLASKGFKIVVKIGEVNIAAEKINKRLAYFPRAEAFPGELKVKDLCRYNAKSTGLTREETNALLEKPEIKSLARKKFKHLDDNEEVDAVLVLTYFTKADIYLIVDLATGYDQEFAIKLNDRMTQLNEDSVVIYLTTKELTVEEEFETYIPDVKWRYIVEVLKEKKKLKERK